MTLDPAIERHRKPLLRIVAVLFAMIGLAEGGAVERLPPRVYRAALRLLNPAESAVRRLIVVVSRSLTLKPARQRATVRAALPATPRQRLARTGVSFRLFDPRPRFVSAFAHERIRHRIRLMPRPEPRLHVIDVSFDPRVPLFRTRPTPAIQEPPPPPPDDTVNALRLCRRLAAVKLALDDLPRQARRYLRWQAKPAEARRPSFSSALRPGAPPGHRKNPRHKVDEILMECDWLARQARPPDSS